MPNKLSTASGYVRMSWAPENLYNLYRLSVKEAQPQHLASPLSFTRTGLTLYQQKWSSKRLLRAYHGDWIGEKRFKRRFLPSSIPPLQQQQQASTVASLSKGKGRTQEKIPLGSLMWREVEARLDVLVFRACFAHSAYEARRLILHGHVKLNGQTVRSTPASELLAQANQSAMPSGPIQISS
jgi:ribosomal protein S4